MTKYGTAEAIIAFMIFYLEIFAVMSHTAIDSRLHVESTGVVNRHVGEHHIDPVEGLFVISLFTLVFSVAGFGIAFARFYELPYFLHMVYAIATLYCSTAEVIEMLGIWEGLLPNYWIPLYVAFLTMNFLLIELGVYGTAARKLRPLPAPPPSQPTTDNDNPPPPITTGAVPPTTTNAAAPPTTTAAAPPPPSTTAAASINKRRGSGKNGGKAPAPAPAGSSSSTIPTQNSFAALAEE